MKQLLTTVLLGVFLSAVALGQSPSALLVDNFTQNHRLNTALWTDNSNFLNALATGFSSSFITPQLSFSPLGMKMTGISQDGQLTGVQSLKTFTAPFTVVTYATPTRGEANPFVIFLASADFTQYLALSANMNPAYDGFWAVAPNIGSLWTSLGEQFSPPIHPQYNRTYTIVLSVDAAGSATVKVESYGTVLGTLSNPRTGGTGPFYLVLGQRIGLVAPTGSQVAYWAYVKVTN